MSNAKCWASIIINRNSFGVFGIYFFHIIFLSPFRDGFFGKTKQKTTKSSTHFRSGYGSDWIGSVLVLVFVIIVAAYQMRNHNEQYTTLLNKLNSILCLWPCDLWKVDTIFAPSLWCLLGYLGNSLCQLPLHLCALPLGLYGVRVAIGCAVSEKRVWATDRPFNEFMGEHLN